MRAPNGESLSLLTNPLQSFLPPIGRPGRRVGGGGNQVGTVGRCASDFLGERRSEALRPPESPVLGAAGSGCNRNLERSSKSIDGL